MTSEIPCPIPQVRDALKPYIRTRQEVHRIRQALTSQLSSSLPNDLPLSQASLGSAPPTNDDDGALGKVTSDPILLSSNSSSLHAQYLAALNAHRAAQARYNAAKADIANLISEQQQPTTPVRYSTEPQSGSKNGVAEYLASLRAQRSQTRADAVLNALDRLASLSPHPAQTDIKSAVRELLGEAPVPPSSGHLSNGIGDGGKEKLDGLVSNVKRAVVKAKVGAEEAQRERERSEKRRRECDIIHGDVDVLVRQKALEKARDELHAWMEGELAKVQEHEEDEEEEDMGNGANGLNGNGTHHGQHQEVSEDVVNEKVHEMYDRYIESRKELLVVVESTLKDHARQKEEQDRPTELTPNSSTPSSPSIRRRNTLQQPSTTPSISALSLLLHLPQLVNTSRTNASILQQTSFLRRSLQQSSTASTSTIQRLAGESHLVPPDTTNIATWAQASQQANEKTREVVREHTLAGQASIERASEELSEWRARREAVDRLKGAK